MPEMLLDSGSEFDRAKAKLGRCLKSMTHVKRALTLDNLQSYRGRDFLAGWTTEIEHKEQLIKFDVLIDAQFPYSPIRVAYKSQDVYLKWPHVEQEGVLCLPEAVASAGVEEAISAAITDAIDLVEQCGDQDFIDKELRREFLSYWNRSRHDDANRVCSLLVPTNHDTREIAVWYGENYILVGETPEQVRSWLQYRGRTEFSEISPGVFGFLDQAPIPPFPKRPVALFSFLKEHCSSAYQKLLIHPIDCKVTVVLGAGSQSGNGLIAFRLSAPNLNGFRKNEINAAKKIHLWDIRSQYQRLTVDRIDPAWIHGRGLNMQQSILQSSTVLVLGCGSLGSQVAVRLAQAGVGALVLVDPDILVSANVGRHALGIGSNGLAKSTELANELRLRFSHMCKVEGHHCSWQDLYAKKSQLFESADLIVACLGEWSADGQLGEWQHRTQTSTTIVYGWLDEYGTAAHALALAGALPALSCVLNSYGDLRVPETLWASGGRVQSEPACGTLFQPYGPIDVARAETLVSHLCVDVLTQKTTLPVHRIFAGSTTQLTEAGGEWSPEHLKYRPPDYNGAFEYERPVSVCGECQACVVIG